MLRATHQHLFAPWRATSTDTLVAGNAAPACWAALELPPRPGAVVELPLSGRPPQGIVGRGGCWAAGNGAAVRLPWTCTHPPSWVGLACTVWQGPDAAMAFSLMQTCSTRYHHLPRTKSPVTSRWPSMIGPVPETAALHIHRSTLHPPPSSLWAPWLHGNKPHRSSQGASDESRRLAVSLPSPPSALAWVRGWVRGSEQIFSSFSVPSGWSPFFPPAYHDWYA